MKYCSCPGITAVIMQDKHKNHPKQTKEQPEHIKLSMQICIRCPRLNYFNKYIEFQPSSCSRLKYRERNANHPNRKHSELCIQRTCSEQGWSIMGRPVRYTASMHSHTNKLEEEKKKQYPQVFFLITFGECCICRVHSIRFDSASRPVPRSERVLTARNITFYNQ